MTKIDLAAAMLVAYERRLSIDGKDDLGARLAAMAGALEELQLSQGHRVPFGGGRLLQGVLWDGCYGAGGGKLPNSDGGSGGGGGFRRG